MACCLCHFKSTVTGSKEVVQSSCGPMSPPTSDEDMGMYDLCKLWIAFSLCTLFQANHYHSLHWSDVFHILLTVCLIMPENSVDVPRGRFLHGVMSMPGKCHCRYYTLYVPVNWIVYNLFFLHSFIYYIMIWLTWLFLVLCSDLATTLQSLEESEKYFLTDEGNI